MSHHLTICVELGYLRINIGELEGVRLRGSTSLLRPAENLIWVMPAEGRTVLNTRPVHFA